ncbi:MAG: hypothetical protein FD159_2631 [Syntrophaceae bacterium]|nr:MAG: hypothetical protein FD159_2631 [Syntrophaceae bacterium]
MFVIGRELFDPHSGGKTAGRNIRFLSRYDSFEMTALGEKGNYNHSR